jgi:C4-dicarboxylate transporter DctQ subunit
MKLQNKVPFIFDQILNALAFVASILIILAAVSVCIEIVARYFFNHPQIWVVETTEYSLLFITFLGTAWLQREEGHVKVDLLLSRLNPRTQITVNIVTSIACAIIFSIITWYGVKTTWSYFQLNYHLPTILSPPQYIIIAIIPLGSFLLFIQFLRRTYRYITSQKAPLDKEQGQPVEPKI